MQKPVNETTIPAPLPDVVTSMSGKAHINSWGCWVQDVQDDLFTDWTWNAGDSPSQHAMLVIEEIDHNCMVSLDVGQDGIPVVTFGIFKFTPPNLHANLFDLVTKFIEVHVTKDGKISIDEREDALRLIAGLDRAAMMIRGRL